MDHKGELLTTYCGVVYPWQCDHQGHLIVSHYVSKFDEATWRMFAAIGMSREYMEEHRIGVAAVRQNISYRHELLPGDLVTIKTAILGINSRQIRFYHEMANDSNGEVASTTVIVGICIDQETRKARPFECDVIDKAKEIIVDITPIM